MIVIKHPTLPIERGVADAALDSWLAAGWLRLLDDEQMARYRELEREDDPAAMTVQQLKAHAIERDIDLAGVTRKADILAAIEAAHDSDAATAADQVQHSDEGAH